MEKEGGFYEKEKPKNLYTQRIFDSNAFIAAFAVTLIPALSGCKNKAIFCRSVKGYTDSAWSARAACF